jgi:hypothetical protein
MKATLLASLLKVNADVEFCQESRADDRGAATGPSGPTPDLGQSPLRVHRTIAWNADVPCRQSQLGHHRPGACDRRPARVRSCRSGRLITISTRVLKNESRAVNLVLVLTDTEGRRRAGDWELADDLFTGRATTL